MQIHQNPCQKTAEKANTFRYLTTVFDKNGWADAQTAHPIPFDLVVVETTQGKTCPAWWNEKVWAGFRLREKDSVIRWKRRKYAYLS